MWMYVCGVDSHGNQKLSKIFVLDQVEGFPLHCDPSLKEGKCVCMSMCVCAHACMNTHTSITLKEFQKMELFKGAEEIPTQMECPRYKDIIPRANC